MLVGSVHVDPGAGWFPHFLGFADETGDGDEPQSPARPGHGRRALAGGRRRAGRVGEGRSPGSSSRSGVDAAAGDPESPLEVSAARLPRGRCAARRPRPADGRRPGGRLRPRADRAARARGPARARGRAEPRDRDLARVPAARRRAARVVSVAPARLPRRRHTRGAGGHGLRCRGDAEARAYRGDRGAGARRRLAAPGGLRRAGRRHALRVRVVRRRPRDRAQGDQGRARPGGTRRRGSSSTASTCAARSRSSSGRWRGSGPTTSGSSSACAARSRWSSTAPPGGPYYQAPGALGTFDGIWHAEGPPCVTVDARRTAHCWPPGPERACASSSRRP